MTAIEDWGSPASQFWLRGERPGEPVQYDESTGLWNVYGHSETLHLLNDPVTFSSDTSRLFPQGDEFADGNLVRMDPPEHDKLRRLVTHAFTPKVVAGLEPRIAELTGELLDAVDGTDRLELVADLAYPLPVIVIAELLGVPADDRGLFKQWVDAMFTSDATLSLKDRTPEQQRELDEVLAQVRNLTDYLGEHVDERRAHPRGDLLTKLVEAEVDGERLTREEVVNFANVLLIAGHITTTMLLGNTVLCLDAHPEHEARTRADRGTLPSVIEESLRFLSPFATLGRVTTAETELGGQRIPADQLLMVWVAAANRDPRQFPNPDVFDPTRHPNPQLGFGRGIHFCLGAPLARLEGKVALDLLLDRFPKLATDPSDPPEFQPNPNMTGVRKLPLRTR
ncbi:MULTISPECIES: cytochrome P450 [unclassified Saccharopolyspora]|uniref:cytochrome P450 n=1 Tax=unclassified Saccharopolyspora TaxID=2646250 RepID=UPI001CD56B24|nr:MULTISPECIES: cytochrome P450 [unclassified Saccharopolyspora]MCA1188729.1 cytochrome P450 [Saccharopolyspora sp. 6T]MCA1192092.1 cytochrome P450 [Saccharopolyspora sp. 6V]MCA1280253.1 cytochrome P450 [Saccharopolyspora sp. 7B]